MTMIIVGVISAVAIPRFFDANIFKSRGFADEVQASLSYAQKTAIAQRRYVCVAFTATSITLTYGATHTCGSPLNYSVTAPSGVTLSGETNFSFNALGKPFDASGNAVVGQQTIAVSGATNNIIVEAETGYVHSP